MNIDFTKRLRFRFLLGIIGLFMMVFIQKSYSASSTANKIILNPRRTEFRVGSEPVSLTILTMGKCHWEMQGVGDLKNTDNCKAQYILPDKITGKSVKTLITVTTTDDNGNSATDSVTLTIIASNPVTLKFIPTPAPTPVSISTATPTPTRVITPYPKFTPTPTPTPDPQIEEADRYFQKGQYLDAEELYRQVFERDKTNKHAQRQLLEIARIYKTWAAKVEVEQENLAVMYSAQSIAIVRSLLPDIAKQTQAIAEQQTRLTCREIQDMLELYRSLQAIYREFSLQNRELGEQINNFIAYFGQQGAYYSCELK